MDKTAAAIRQRRHRDRRHRGFVCVTVEIGADDIGGLIDRGLLGELFIQLAGSEAINEYFEFPATSLIRSYNRTPPIPGAGHVPKVDHL
jgi:hypothetical protein